VTDTTNMTGEVAAVLRDTTAGLQFAQMRVELALYDIGETPQPANGAADLLRRQLGPARDFRDRVLGPVLAVRDEEYQRILLDTLDTWLASGEAGKAAAVLFCHPNTVRNRLRFVERLTGRRLATPVDVVDLALALEAHRLLAPGGRP
jgi:DNA-binding PucR family transcriptional regulator